VNDFSIYLLIVFALFYVLGTVFLFLSFCFDSKLAYIVSVVSLAAMFVVPWLFILVMI